MYVVIGSGPSGVACASAIVNAGVEVTLLDAGHTLEPERAARKAAMAARDPAQWTAAEIAAARTPIGPSGEIASKLDHGSDYPYRSAPGAAYVDNRGLGVRGSYALGGLSSVWGSALLPFRQEDMAGWPISAGDLAQAQAAVLSMMPLSAERDDLAEFFPLHSPPTDHAKKSEQVERLMGAMRHNRARLAASGIHFGASRLAVRFGSRAGERSCNYCGHCLHGCPRDLIYSSSQSLRNLLGTGKLTYIAGVTVKEIAEEEGKASVFGMGWDGAPHRLAAARVFLAAGVLNSTEILLRSFGWYERTIDIADSQYYLFPLLQLVATSNVAAEKLHTLAQAFVEIIDDEISPYAVHLQIYSYNDLLRDILRKKLGAARHVFPENMLLGRFLLAQGYLHSQHSGRIAFTLHKRAHADRVVLRGVRQPDTRKIVLQVLAKLWRAAPALRAIPLTPLLQITEPGRGFHIGGSFPMNAAPGSGQTDPLGRPFGWSRTHVVDASILPSIPATTITQTVMANAYRIGHLAAALD